MIKHFLTIEVDNDGNKLAEDLKVNKKLFCGG